MEIFYSKKIKGDKITLSTEESAHCVRVLRYAKGDSVMVSGGDGNLYRCLLEKDSPVAAELQIVKIEGGFGGHNYFLHVAVAPTKNNERFEWFLEKATEIGVDEITPLLCDHSERKVVKEERMERVVLAAAKQSLKGFVPKVHPLTAFKEFISGTAHFEGKRLIAYCDRTLIDSEGVAVPRVPIMTALKSGLPGEGTASKAMILIGPEGDFSREEVQIAVNAGFVPISFGESRLRTETAALLAVSSLYLASQ